LNRVFWILAALLSLAISAQASAAPAKIFVEATTNDPIGQSIAYELREKINSSSLYTITYSRDEALFVISLVTIDAETGHTSAYSAALLMPPFNGKGFDYFITERVGYCGKDVVASCASGILSSFDGSMSEVIEGFRRALKDRK
jgi:hypothetical protein